MSRRWRNFLKNWAPALAFMVAIFAVSHVRFGNLTVKVFSLFDKVVHASEYAVLCWLLFRGLRMSRRPWLCQWSPAVALLLAAAYGATDEFHQYFVGRECDVKDWGADVLGAATMAVLCWAWRRCHADPRENEPTDEW